MTISARGLASYENSIGRWQSVHAWDDQKTLRSLRPNWTFFEANNGKEALTVIAEMSPQFIISDNNMPTMNGLTLLETLRSQGNQIPFGFLTAQANLSFITQANQQGASFVWAKPFHPKRVVDAIEMAVL